MADDLKDTIKQNAEGPKQASADGVSTQQHSLEQFKYEMPYRRWRGYGMDSYPKDTGTGNCSL